MFTVLALGYGIVLALIGCTLRERKLTRQWKAADAAKDEGHKHALAFHAGIHRQAVADHAANLARLAQEHEAALDSQRAAHASYVAAVKGGAQENEKAWAKQSVEYQAELTALRPYRDQRAKVMAVEGELAALRKEMSSMADRHAQQVAAIHSEKDGHKREAERHRVAHEQLAEKHKQHRAESWDQYQAQIEADRRGQVHNMRRALLALPLPAESLATIDAYFARIQRGWVDAMRARHIAEQDAKYAEQKSQDTGDTQDGT